MTTATTAAKRAWRWPSAATWAVGGALTCSALAVYGVAGACARRRAAVPLFDASHVVRVDEHARYPCTVLRGCDVVVRNYYVRSDARTAQRQHAEAPPWWRRYTAVFSADTHHLNADRDTPHTAHEQASVRIVVDDNAMTSAQDGNTATPSSWPAGTHKYAALVLESSSSKRASRSSSSDDDDENGNARAMLRALADAATHQSLLRCDERRSAAGRHNCIPDTATLAAPYTRVMLAAFALLPPSTLQTMQVALLGVGGGALAGFVQRHFAPVLRRVDLVDVEPQCLRAAVQDMGLAHAVPLSHRACVQLCATAAAADDDDDNNSDGHVVVGARDEADARSDDGVHVHARDGAAFLRDVVAHTTSLSTALSLHDQHVHVHDLISSSSNSSSGVVGDEAADTTAATATALLSRRQLPRRRYDVLFVDMFVGSQLTAASSDVSFLRLTRAALSPYGVAAFNVPSRHGAHGEAFVQRCRAVYGDAHVYCVPVPASANVIVLAHNTSSSGSSGSTPVASTMTAPVLSPRHLYRRTVQMQRAFALPYDIASHYPVWWRYW